MLNAGSQMIRRPRTISTKSCGGCHNETQQREGVGEVGGVHLVSSGDPGESLIQGEAGLAEKI